MIRGVVASTAVAPRRISRPDRSRAAQRIGRVVLLAVVVILLAPDRALADPAGPTDYQTEVTAIVPPIPEIEVTIIGGDSFVELAVAPGIEVVVLGYSGEPYLWFRTDGTVMENRRSPAHYYNEERFGGRIAPSADPDAPADWYRLTRDGRWAWHDHRAHRMEAFPPLNADRGDEVLDGVIPVVVDGEPVAVHVTSTWMPAPSRLPMWFGGAAGILGIGLTWRWGRGLPALGIIAALATALGAIQFRSLPGSTDPMWTWWLAPLLALVFTVVALTLDTPRIRSTTVASACGAIAGLQLVVWGWERRNGLHRAILPTEAPYWLDRTATAAALTAGAFAATVMVLRLTGLIDRMPGRSPLGDRLRP